MEPLCRLCPDCVTLRNISYKTYLQRPCKDSARCSCEGHTCIGSEAHYVNFCPITRKHWRWFISFLRNHHGVSAPTVQQLLNPVDSYTTFQWRAIGRTLSQTITRTLADAEDVDITIRLLEVGDPRLSGPLLYSSSLQESVNAFC